MAVHSSDWRFWMGQASPEDISMFNIVGIVSSTSAVAVSDWLNFIIYLTTINFVRGSPHSSQTSQWLQLIPPWLLISAKSSHFCHCSVYIQPTPSVSFSHSNILRVGYKFIEFGEPLLVHIISGVTIIYHRVVI